MSHETGRDLTGDSTEETGYTFPFIDTELTDEQRNQVSVTALSFGMTEEELVIMSVKNRSAESSIFAAVQTQVQKLHNGTA